MPTQIQSLQYDPLLIPSYPPHIHQPTHISTYIIWISSIISTYPQFYPPIFTSSHPAKLARLAGSLKINVAYFNFWGQNCHIFRVLNHKLRCFAMWDLFYLCVQNIFLIGLILDFTTRQRMQRILIREAPFKFMSHLFNRALWALFFRADLSKFAKSPFWRYIYISAQSILASNKLLNNTIPDGGVAPRHLLRLDWVTRKDLKGQNKM